MSPVSSKPERALRNSSAATTDSTPIHEADFLARFARVSRADDLWRNNLYVWYERAVNEHVEDEWHHKDIDEKVQMAEKGSLSEFGYARPTPGNARCMI